MMLNETKNVHDALKDILPTYYEYFMNDKCVWPCISYREYRNEADEQSDRIGYSTIAYYIKIWADDIDTVQDYAEAVDDAMRMIGYKRTNGQELVIDKMICKIFAYTAKGFEDFREE